jgi:hypothetical protein
LRLQWAWLKWKAPDKPFAGLPISLNNTEKELLSVAQRYMLAMVQKQNFGQTIALRALNQKT